MAIEFFDSFDLGINPARYSASTTGTATGRFGAGLGLAAAGTSCGVARNVTARTTYIAGIAYLNPSAPNRVNSILRFQEQAGTIHVILQYNAAGFLEARKGTSGGTLFGTSSSIIHVAGSYRAIAAQVFISATVGTIDVWVDGVACPGLTGLTGLNTDNGGGHTINQIPVSNDGVFNTGAVYDDFWIFNTTGSINNAFPGDLRSAYAPSNAAGTYTSATASSGTLLSCVSEATANNGDTNYVIQDNTSLPKKVSFNITDTPADALAIIGVKPFAVVRKDDAGVNTGRVGCKSSSTEVDIGSDQTVLSAYNEFSFILDADPNTSSAWSSAGFNALEVWWERIS